MVQDGFEGEALRLLTSKSSDLSGGAILWQSLILLWGLVLTWFGLLSLTIALAAIELKGSALAMGVGLISCLGGGFCLGRPLSRLMANRRYKRRHYR